MTPPPDRQLVLAFRSLVADLLGLQVDDSKLDGLARVLHHHASAASLEASAYLERLTGTRGGHEQGLLARDLTVTETYFLRNSDQFRVFVEVALPDCLAARGFGGGVHVLSAGCASGEEPYSLAIAAREHQPAMADAIAITGVDVNPAMLQKAQRARYSTWSLRECSPELRSRWFKPDGDAFMLVDSIRRCVAFEARNLAEDCADLWLPGRWDIVFCRNVLMYFETERARAAIERIARSLAPGGYLFLGHAETLRGLSEDFHLCHTHETFYYQRKRLLVQGGSRAGQGISAAAQLPAALPAPLAADTGWVDTIRRSSERIHALAGASRHAREQASPAGATLKGALDELKNERFAGALEQLGALAGGEADNPDVRLLQAVSLSHTGAFTQAAAVCRELLARDEFNAGARYVLALCCEGAGDSEAALEHSQAAAYLDPGFAMPRLHVGLLARRRGNPAAARMSLDRALALLQREDASRLLLFGGGFQREALMGLCRAELAALGEAL